MASHDLFLRLIITVGLLSLVPSLIFCTTLAVADQYVNDQSFLQLPLGLNLSILANSHNASTTSSSPGLSFDLMFKVAIASLLDEYQGFFFPILSSPSFNLISYSRGFSLGFYFEPVEPESQKYIVYLAVCAVFSGNYTDPPTIWYYYLNSSFNHGHLYPVQSSDSFVFPVWIANLDKPIKDWEKASLGVVAAAAADSSADSSDDTTVNELQLKEGDEIVWNVSNVGMMEMRDSGDLLICSTAPCSTENVAWESFDMAGTDSRSDTLVQGQKLTVGGELKSNDSKYLARMEKGGLVLYLNNGPRFDGTVNNTQQGLQQPPYWIFPMFNPSAPANASINQLISTAPCNNSPAFTVLDQLLDHSLAYNTTKLILDPGSICSNLLNSTTIFSSSQNSDSSISWSFLRLENDGRLYVYTINNYAHAAPSFTKLNAPDSNSSPMISQWPVPEYCDVPMACGPVGVCTPGAQTPCSCPPSIYFKARNNTDLSQGCERQTSLPACTAGAAASDQHINSTDFLELSSTASIFLFNGWSFKPTHAPVSHCKSLCSSACSCNGFFHQADHHNVNISACFFITGEFTLLSVVDENLSSLNYNTADELPDQQRAVIARNYATYLKVVSDLPISGSDKRSSATADNKPAAAQASLIVILPTIVAAFLMIGLVCIAAYRLLRARKRKSAQIRRQAEDEKELQDILPLLPSRFSYKDLHEATKGFSNLLGAGGCGSVYSGILWDGRKVAVKVLQVVLKGAEQSRQFLAEVGTIGRTSHHNIVRLYGFCWELSHRLLVYEYVERGSLDHWLFNVDDRPEAFLDWRTRYNVALGIGRGMHYLHEECEPPILHFDIKPQNILLAEDFVAKLADFGMSRLIPRDASSVVTGVRGTPGYIAPEWLSHGKVSKKSDIFSMGMVLLELVGGRKIWDFSLLNSSLDPVEQEAWHLPRWGASMCEQGLMTELVDKRLHVCGFDQEEPQRLIHIAFWCIHDDPAMRPSALMVVQWLAEGTPPRKCPLFSTVINAALYYNKPLATNSVYIDESQ